MKIHRSNIKTKYVQGESVEVFSSGFSLIPSYTTVPSHASHNHIYGIVGSNGNQWTKTGDKIFFVHIKEHKINARTAVDTVNLSKSHWALPFSAWKVWTSVGEIWVSRLVLATGAKGKKKSWTMVNISLLACKHSRKSLILPKPLSHKYSLLVSGYANKGELLAIMGPAAAGKSTLCNALSFQNTQGLKVLKNSFIYLLP